MKFVGTKWKYLKSWKPFWTRDDNLGNITGHKDASELLTMYSMNNNKVSCELSLGGIGNVGIGRSR